MLIENGASLYGNGTPIVFTIRVLVTISTVVVGGKVDSVDGTSIEYGRVSHF